MKVFIYTGIVGQIRPLYTIHGKNFTICCVVLVLDIFDFNMYRILGWIWRLCEFCLGFRTYTTLNVDTPPEPTEDGYKYKVSFEGVKVHLFWRPMFILDKKWAPRLFNLHAKMFPLKVIYK